VTENEIGDAIFASAVKVHSAVGPGLLESAYEICLLYELEKRGLPVRRQVSIPIRYEDLTIDNGHPLDLLVGKQVLVELKAIEANLPVHRGQLLSYLRLGGFKLGYLLNFHLARMRDASSGWPMGSDSPRPLRGPLRPLRGEANFLSWGVECMIRH
jgi:GxxExxY protein